MNNTAIEKLDRDLIKKTDLESLARLFPSIRHDFEVKPIYRTETEARISVLNEIHFPTPHSKYWQSIREQQVHFDQLVQLSFDFRRKKIELKKLEIKIAKETDELEQQLLNIDIEEKQYQILNCEKIASERVREVEQWAKIKDELIEAHADEIDTEDVDVMQLKSYTETFILEMFNSGPNLNAGEAQNVIGKMRTAVNRCKELGVWEEVVQKMKLSQEDLKRLGE